MSELHASLHYADGKYHITATQDCTPYAERAHALRTAGAIGDQEGLGRRAASFPNVLVEQYCHNNGITFQEWMQNPVHATRMLNDPALKAFRVWEGTV